MVCINYKYADKFILDFKNSSLSSHMRVLDVYFLCLRTMYTI